jgi:hypothetical protein
VNLGSVAVLDASGLRSLEPAWAGRWGGNTSRVSSAIPNLMVTLVSDKCELRHNISFLGEGIRVNLPLRLN